MLQRLKNKMRPFSALSASLVLVCCHKPASGPSEVVDPVDYADPFVGSGGFGFAAGSAFPGALAPQGLVKVGPDTTGPYGDINFLHYSGYWYGDDTIRGFSHMHLHGTGNTDYGILALMPVSAFDAMAPVASAASTFQKRSEHARPGYYDVILTNGLVHVELTASPHAAIHRFSFPAGLKTGTVIVDLDHHLFQGKVTAAEAQVDTAAQRVSGKLHHIGQMSGGTGYDVFFELRARRPWKSAQVWSSGVAPTEGSSVTGVGGGLALAFDNTPATPLEIAVGLSMVSLAGARANLDAEVEGRGFDDVRRATENAWRTLLSTVRISGGSEEERHTFYSMLYHAFLMPTVVSDVDSSYRAMDGQIRKADGFRYCTDMSLWDTYRTLDPLYAVIAPDGLLDTVRSLYAMAQANGGVFPTWPVGTGDAATMPGASPDIVIAEAALKGVTGFDLKGVYALLRAGALSATPPPGGRGGRSMHFDDYDRLGYIPAPAGGSVSITTEYARDDYALAQLATLLGETADADRLLARSKGYRKLFDPTTGFLRGHLEDGTLAPGAFDPIAWDDKAHDDYVESNAWQSVWMPSNDIVGLVGLFGSRDAFIAKLESFFEQAVTDADSLIGLNPDDLKRSLPRPYYFAGNEPDIHAPYLFAAAGRPDLTQRWVRWAMTRWYGSGADGLPGNDDGGTMSAWYVFSALGFFPMPGTDRYLIGAPLFPRARIAISGGEFLVEAPKASGANIFVQSVTLNGQPLTAPILRHGDIRPGGALHFEMGPSPSVWGRSETPGIP